MKKIVIVLVAFILFNSCKDEKKDDTVTETKKEVKKEATANDKLIDKALENGLFVANEKGLDLVIDGQTIYLIGDKTNNPDDTKYFLHVMQDNKEAQKLDFMVGKALLDNLVKYENFTICKRTIPETIDTSVLYKVNYGEIEEGKGRIWNTYLFSNKLKPNSYDQRYLANIDKAFNNFDKEFSEALDNGFFIRRQNDFDLLYYDDYLYYIRQNATDQDLVKKFFFHVNVGGSDKPVNLDFYFNTFNKVSSEYEDLSIAKRKFPANSISFVTGQFDQTGRKWSTSYKIENIFGNEALIYDNQYRPDEVQVNE